MGAEACASLFPKKRPVDTDNSLVREASHRLRKDEINRTLSLIQPDNSEVRSAWTFLDCHYSMVPYLRLKMTVDGWFLPKRVNLWLAAFFDDLRKASDFDFDEFHI